MRGLRMVARGWALAVAVLLVAFVGVALAAGNSVHIRAPKHAHIGGTITVTFFGTTSGHSRKFLAAFSDQSGLPCAATGLAEGGRSGVQERDFVGLGRHYKRRLRITNLHRSYICAYLQVRNKAAGYPTLARASFRYS